MVRSYSRKAVSEEINNLLSDGWDMANASKIAKQKARLKFCNDYPASEIPPYLWEDNNGS